MPPETPDLGHPVYLGDDPDLVRYLTRLTRK
jgi:hypothetical protein